MDMMDVLVVLLRAEIIKVRVNVDLPADFFSTLDKALEDKELNGPELADLIDALRGK